MGAEAGSWLVTFPRHTASRRPAGVLGCNTQGTRPLAHVLQTPPSPRVSMTLPNAVTRWGPNVQIHEPMETFLIQITTIISF